MIKTIIATLILLTFPLLSQADMSIYEGVSIGANANASVNGSIDGTVTAVDDTTFTIKDTKSNTTYVVNTQSDASMQNDLEVGQNVIVYGDKSTTTNTIEATSVDKEGNDFVVASSTTEVNVEGDGFFRRMINWFKSWFN